MSKRILDWDNFRDERRLVGRPFVVAHRGAPTVEPENTLRSFLLALVQGADALETDLRFTRDDELILFPRSGARPDDRGQWTGSHPYAGRNPGAAHPQTRRYPG